MNIDEYRRWVSAPRALRVPDLNVPPETVDFDMANIPGLQVAMERAARTAYQHLDDDFEGDIKINVSISINPIDLSVKAAVELAVPGIKIKSASKGTTAIRENGTIRLVATTQPSLFQKA